MLSGFLPLPSFIMWAFRLAQNLYSELMQRGHTLLRRSLNADAIKTGTAVGCRGINENRCACLTNDIALHCSEPGLRAGIGASL